MCILSKDPPQANYRATLSQLVRRLEQARTLANQRADPTLVSELQSALDTATTLLGQRPRQAVSAASKVRLTIEGIRAIEYIVDLVQSLYSIF